MPITAIPSSPSEDAPPVERNRTLLLSLGVLLLVSAVIAAVVIIASGGSEQPVEPPVAEVSATERAVVIGDPSASGSTKVVVQEDFGSADSREFEIASRDFLRIAADRGDAVVEYRPVSLRGATFSAAALAAWGAVLEQGRPSQALALHDLIFDRQPAARAAATDFAEWAKDAGVKDSDVLAAVQAVEADRAADRAAAAGVRTTPTVLVDGKPLTADTPTALADKLQRLVLEASTS